MEFGSSETLTCLEPLEFTGPSGQELCLAYKLKTMSLVLPVYITDDGYVLKVEGEDQYFPLTPDLIEDMQTEGSLSDPLPSYSITTMEYAVGYSFWLALVVSLLVSGVAFVRISRRLKRQRARAFVNVSRRAGQKTICLVAKNATRDPNSDAEAGCMLLTDQELIYSGGSGGELVIARDAITEVDTTPIVGVAVRHRGTQLRISYSDAGEPQVLRIQVGEPDSWLKELASHAA